MNDDRVSIAEAIYRYAERIDAGDFDGVAEELHGAVLSFEGHTDSVQGRGAIKRLYESTTKRYEDGTPRTKHVITNVIVDLDPSGTSASSRSTFTVYQAVPDALTLQPIIAGRYHHDFEKQASTWRITAMRINVQLIGDIGQHLLMELGEP